jgi:hypothetical protein
MINSHGIRAKFQNMYKFSVEGNLTDIFIVNTKIKANCGESGFKYGMVTSSQWIAASGGITMVNLCDCESDHLTSQLDLVWYEDSPRMPDGRPIVRSDSRPINAQTIFTMAGDTAEAIGNGKELVWDFSNDDDLYIGSDIPSGYKAKEIKISFMCPIHTKDGCIYFFDAPWGCYVQMDIIVPSGYYYPNPAGMIPAKMLGLQGDKMYSQATEDTLYQRYVNKHRMFGTCPMGDELNAEGSSENPLPIGWYIRGLIVTPESDNISKGFASIEMHRCHTVLLPGMTNPHA